MSESEEKPKEHNPELHTLISSIEGKDIMLKVPATMALDAMSRVAMLMGKTPPWPVPESIVNRQEEALQSFMTLISIELLQLIPLEKVVSVVSKFQAATNKDTIPNPFYEGRKGPSEDSTVH